MSSFSPGTQVVLLAPTPPHPRGALARILSRTETTAEVQLATGDRHTLPIAQLTPVKHYLQLPSTELPPLLDHVILATIIGSHAYGLAHPGSDIDRRGVFLPPAARHWSLHGVPHTLQHPTLDAQYWELQRFLELALQSKPQPLEVLFSPIVEHATPLGHELRALRPHLVSRLAYQSYTGYALSAHRQLLKATRKQPENPPFKDWMHLIRLLMNARDLLLTGTLPVDMEDHRDTLLAIRRGERSLESLEAERTRLLDEVEHAYASSHLPERPNVEAVDAFLIRARRSRV